MLILVLSWDSVPFLIACCLYPSVPIWRKCCLPLSLRSQVGLWPLLLLQFVMQLVSCISSDIVLGLLLQWSSRTSCKTRSLDPFLGALVPLQLFETHYTQRKIHLYHVLEDELCIWRPTEEDVTQLNDHGIEVTLISGNALWMGKRNHSYGHFVFSGLGPGLFSIAKILNVPGVVPLFEKQKAPLRLMSWCTYRIPDSSKYLLQALSARCGEPTTTDEQLVSIAHSGLPHVDTVPALKDWLLQQLLCQVDGRVLPNYCGVLGEFLMDLPLPRIIYMLDYYLPQLQPWDKGSLRELSTMAAPIHFCPQKMYMYFQRKDDEFCHYSFVNEGGNPFVMTPTNAQKCFHTIDYVKKFEGKPLEVGRVIAIVFHLGGHTAPLCVVIGIVMDSRPRGRAKWLNDTTVPPQERGYGVTHHKCNPRSLDLALLRVEAAQVFCDSTIQCVPLLTSSHRYHTVTWLGTPSRSRFMFVRFLPSATRERPKN